MTLARRGVRLAVALAVGCGSPRPPVAEPPAPVVAVPPASTPVASLPPAEKPAAPPPAEVREPTQLACKLSSPDWSSDQLRLRAGGPRFARVSGAPASVLLPVVSSPTEAVAVMDDGHVLVRAVLAVADVHLYASKPAPLLGIVTPAADLDLSWTSSTAGSVRVGIDTQNVLRSPAPFVADVGCGELALVPAGYDARASVTRRSKLAKRGVITDGAPLSPSPGAAAVAELRQDVVVELLETRGGRARILIDESYYVVSGWVAVKDLGPPLITGTIGRGGGGGAPGFGIHELFLTRCPADLGLFVELGSERVKVGVIRAGSGFQLTPKSATDTSGFRAIDLPSQPWLMPEKTARWVVDAAALEPCRTDSRGM